jgi:hypothetical protein
MNAELKAKWLAALRSGEFVQGKGELLNDRQGSNKRYCCLGVLAICAGISEYAIARKSSLDHINRNDLIGPWNLDEKHQCTAYNSFNEDTWDTPQRRLAGMNDNGEDFLHIAAWIEANIPAEPEPSP